MKISILTTALLILVLTTSAFAQQAKLEGHIYTHMNVPVSTVRIIAPGGQAAVTSTKGRFLITFDSPIQPGQATRIEVAKPGWVIYEPMLGNCATQSAARNYELLKVIIVPKGSPLALSPKRLSQVIARWSDERNKLRSQVGELKSQLDEYVFLREYAEKYGFTLDQFSSAAEQWAKSAESNDKYEQALKEYFLKNYSRAAELAHESALIADEELEQLTKERTKASIKVIDRFKLEGNALYEQNKYREAIASYGEIDRRFSTRKILKEDVIEEWAEVKRLLGKAKAELGSRVEGEESKRLLSESEKEYQQAFAVYTRESMPYEWAVTQNHLGVTLWSQGKRVAGEEGVRLLARAREACIQALTVYTREEWPETWALLQTSLGVVLKAQSERVSGEESERLLRQAVEAYKEALKIRTREAFPLDWAQTQANLGSALRAYGERIGGDEGVRLRDQSVGAYRQALTVYTREAHPQDWARVQNSLGNALSSKGQRLPGEEGVEMLKQAAEALREALTVYTRDALPQQWAMTKNNLGAALRVQGERTGGEEGERLLRQAVEAYKEVLVVRTREAFPLDWASTLRNLGAALIAQSSRVSEEKGIEMLRQAIEACRQALTVYTREASPQDWAMTQNNIAVALGDQGRRIGGEEGERLLNQSVEAFRQALTVYTRASFPQDWADTQNNLAKTFTLLEDWENALNCLINVLAIDPKNESAYLIATSINQNVFFNYTEAFRLSQQWIENNPGVLSAEANFAEMHFTRARFSECERQIVKVLTHPDLEASTKVFLHGIEIANLIALEKANLVSAKIDALIAAIASQPAGFQVIRPFDGTQNFISEHEKLASHSAWLDQLFEALKGSDREAILKGLKEVRAKFRQ